MTRPDLARHREPLTVHFSARTDAGRVRDANEDHFLVDRKLRLFVVCDGLGGHASGEIASSLAVNAVHEAIVRRSDLLEAFEFDTGAVSERDILDLLRQAVTHANSTVTRHAAEDASLRGMATTLSLLLVARDRAFLAHVGDTRVYRLRDGDLRQLSDDHSLAAELQRGLELPPALAARLDTPHGSPITRAIGADSRVDVDVAVFDARAGDRFLLASDGLHGHLDAARIGAVLVLADVGAIADRLVDEANLAGGRDNITAIALALEDSPSSTSPRRIWPEFDAIRAAPGLRSLSDEVIASIVERSQALELGAGDLLLTEERTTSIPGLFVVADGEMSVSQGGLVQSLLRVGDTFGEESLLIERTSTASYAAGDTGARLPPLRAGRLRRAHPEPPRARAATHARDLTNPCPPARHPRPRARRPAWLPQRRSPFASGPPPHQQPAPARRHPTRAGPTHALARRRHRRDRGLRPGQAPLTSDRPAGQPRCRAVVSARKPDLDRHGAQAPAHHGPSRLPDRDPARPYDDVTPARGDRAPAEACRDAVTAQPALGRAAGACAHRTRYQPGDGTAAARPGARGPRHAAAHREARRMSDSLPHPPCAAPAKASGLRAQAARLATLAPLAMAVALVACGKAPIPERVDPEAIRKELLAADPARLLTGGNRIFFDDFERPELGDRWVIERIPSEPKPPVWRLEGGWLRNDDAKNQGAWVKAIPETGNVRIEFLAVSDPPVRGRFVGDLKCEAFATEPAHEKGYSFINGGWNNTLDTIAKLGEHSADDKRVPAVPVVEGQVHRYAVILDGHQLHFFRDGQILYSFDDPDPVRGPWFGFNNWLTNARFDELAIYTF